MNYRHLAYKPNQCITPNYHLRICLSLDLVAPDTLNHIAHAGNPGSHLALGMQQCHRRMESEWKGRFHVG